MSSETESPSAAPPDVGARLRAAREAKHITLREIAATTKISVSALEALEENDVARLPGGIFTRAFVKAYASEVGLDPDVTMRDFMAQVPSETAADAAKRDRRTPEHDEFQSQQRMAGTALTLLLVGVPLAGLLLYLGIRGAPASEEEPAADPLVAVSPAEAPATPPPAAAPAADPTPPPAARAEEPPLSLVLSPSGDCWVSLTIDGALVFSRVMRGGERESYEASEEIVLNIGDAGAFGYAINELPGRSLGGSGEVVTARITHRNYDSYVSP